MVELGKGQAIGVGVRSVGCTGLDQRRGIAGSCQGRNGECLESHVVRAVYYYVQNAVRTHSTQRSLHLNRHRPARFLLGMVFENWLPDLVVTSFGLAEIGI